MLLYSLAPVPAGISLPRITFSLSPCNISHLPRVAASVKILVVSWNEAADKNESVSRDALVIPSITGFPVAGTPPAKITGLFISANSLNGTASPSIRLVSPGSITLILVIILLTTVSTCLSETSTP